MSPAAKVDDAWYPERFWVADDERDQYPFRYGDLFRAPDTDAFGRPLVSAGAKRTPWMGVLVLSSSCDLVSKTSDEGPITVVRVKDLSQQSGPQQAAVAAGWKPTEAGPVVAFASFAYLAPCPSQDGFAKGMYADFRDVAVIRYGDLKVAGRVAALDHDARVALIRREMCYRYRWLVPISSVRDAEAARIRQDTAFLGPTSRRGRCSRGGAFSGAATGPCAGSRQG